MGHTYEITKDNNIMVDGNNSMIIKTNDSLDVYQRELQAYDIIDYILEDEDDNLSDFLPWFAVMMDDNDSDWGTGSFDFVEASCIAISLNADHIEKIFRGVCEEYIEIKRIPVLEDIII